MTSWSIMQVISDYRRSIIVQKYTFSMFFESTHTPHINRIRIVTEESIVISNLILRN